MKKMNEEELHDLSVDFVISLFPVVDAFEDTLSKMAEDPDTLSVDINVFITFAHRLLFMGWTRDELVDLLEGCLPEKSEAEQVSLQ
jgi:hypothetical protein